LDPEQNSPIVSGPKTTGTNSLEQKSVAWRCGCRPGWTAWPRACGTTSSPRAKRTMVDGSGAGLVKAADEITKLDSYSIAAV